MMIQHSHLRKWFYQAVKIIVLYIALLHICAGVCILIVQTFITCLIFVYFSSLIRSLKFCYNRKVKKEQFVKENCIRSVFCTWTRYGPKASPVITVWRQRECAAKKTSTLQNVGYENIFILYSLSVIHFPAGRPHHYNCNAEHYCLISLKYLNQFT